MTSETRQVEADEVAAIRAELRRESKARDFAEACATAAEKERDGFKLALIAEKERATTAEAQVAAAPDLLEALWQCVGSLKALGAESGFAAEAARAAIAKATQP